MMHLTNTVLLAATAAALPFPQGSRPIITQTDVQVTNFKAYSTSDYSSYTFDVNDGLGGIQAHCSAVLSQPDGDFQLQPVYQDVGNCSRVSGDVVDSYPIDKSIFDWTFVKTANGATFSFTDQGMSGYTDIPSTSFADDEIYYEYYKGATELCITVSTPIYSEPPQSTRSTITKRDSSTIDVSDFTVQRGPEGTHYYFHISDEAEGIIAATCEADVPPTPSNTNIDSVQGGTCTSYDPDTGIPAKEPISTFSWYFSRTSDAGILGITYNEMGGVYDTFTFGRSGSAMYEYVTGPKDFCVEISTVGPPIQKLARRTEANDVKVTGFSAIRDIDSSSYNFDVCDELNQITAHCSADVPAPYTNGNNLDSVTQGTCTSVDENGVPAKEPISSSVFEWSFTVGTYGGTLYITDNGLFGSYAGFATSRSGSQMFEYINEPSNFTVTTTTPEPPKRR